MSDFVDKPSAAVDSSATSAAPHGRCGKCGYMVHPEAGFICSECGSDLRKVGIATSKTSRAGIKGRIFRFLVVAVPWLAICWTAFGLSFDPVDLYLWPLAVHSNLNCKLVPLDNQYRDVTITDNLDGIFWGRRNASRPMTNVYGKISYNLVGTINGKNGPIVLRVDLMHGMTWLRTGGAEGEKTGAVALNKTAVLDWLTAGGADISRPSTQQEADELFGIITSLGSPVAKGASFDDICNVSDVANTFMIWRASAFDGAMSPRSAIRGYAYVPLTPAWLAMGIFVYLSGLWLWFRRLRKHAAIPAITNLANRETLAVAASAQIETSLPPARPPQVFHRLLSILFSDVKDYTAQSAAQSRSGVLDIVRRHRDRVIPIVNRHGGRIVKQMGDGILATFESATDAVLAGMEIQSSPSGNGAPTAPPTDGAILELRIGISTGEVSVEADDVFGPAVNLASRVQQLAEAGQVLFTEATFSMLNGREVSAIEVGKFDLKGIPLPVKVYQAAIG